jgi:hypothetical protein
MTDMKMKGMKTTIHATTSKFCLHNIFRRIIITYVTIIFINPSLKKPFAMSMKIWINEKRIKITLGIHILSCSSPIIYYIIYNIYFFDFAFFIQLTQPTQPTHEGIWWFIRVYNGLHFFIKIPKCDVLHFIPTTSSHSEDYEENKFTFISL